MLPLYVFVSALIFAIWLGKDSGELVLADLLVAIATGWFMLPIILMIRLGIWSTKFIVYKKK